MKLVLIDRGRVVKVYEESCSEFEIDHLFDDYVRLLKFEKEVKKPVTLTGANLHNFMQSNLIEAIEQAEARRRIAEKADNYLKRKAKTTGNNLGAFFKNLLNRLILRWRNRKDKPKK